MLETFPRPDEVEEPTTSVLHEPIHAELMTVLWTDILLCDEFFLFIQTEVPAWLTSLREGQPGILAQREELVIAGAPALSFAIARLPTNARTSQVHFEKTGS